MVLTASDCQRKVALGTILQLRNPMTNHLNFNSFETDILYFPRASSLSPTFEISNPWRPISAYQYLDERWFASSVLSKHNNNLWISLLPFLQRQLEATLWFGHLRVFVGCICEKLAYLEGKGLISKSQILSGHKPRQQDIETFSHGERQSHHTVSTRFSIKTTDEIG
jgi:hypothetical protein